MTKHVFLKVAQKDAHLHCRSSLTELGVRARPIRIFTPYISVVLFHSYHFFSYPLLHRRSAPSENVPQKGTSFELTVTYANGQARKIYLLGPNILHALVLQSSILLILLINVSGYERSNLSKWQYSVSRVFAISTLMIINGDKRRFNLVKEDCIRTKLDVLT